MDFKVFNHEVKDMDQKQGIIVAFANAYMNEDDDGDMSARGSFNKTVSENKKRIRVFKDHDKKIGLGIPLEIDPSHEFGLLTKSQFNLKKEVSRDMFSDIELMMEHGLNAELSIGYDAMRRDAKEKAIITEYKLWEYSFLTSWAANEMAIVSGVKEKDPSKNLITLIAKSYDLKYSDTRLRAVEKLLESLSATPLEDTLEDEKEAKELVNQITNLYKIRN